MFDYTIETSKSIEDTVKALEENLKTEQFGVLWAFDIKHKLQEKGLKFEKDYKVLEVCNPFEAQRVLEENKLAGYFLPCKIVVYDDEGKTKIGLPRPTALISVLNDMKIKEFAKDIEVRLIHCIDQSI
ncbi:MAG TPA: DUF302 domain-containing protein [Ureibacillus sp.]|uniref:DUF302 domain-containing protein n=1 Tax=Peribacillus asahii TaxID=228899 RepID=UPI002079584C|nr:DUF302 domain-containing protein [Peribacillus asahii]USK57927.1 DUF302 domain-containing protein [Peribacillus asahii]HWL26809.1 DUF302 domain-containing protein [Ureibacillus sp.]